MATLDTYIPLNMNASASGPDVEIDLDTANEQYIAFTDFFETYLEEYYGTFVYDIFGDLSDGIIQETYSWERNSPFSDWELRVAITGLNADVEIVLELNSAGETAELNAYLFRSHDTMLGSDFSDRLNSYDGSDLIYGYGGHDTLKGMAGADSLSGGAGQDRLIGGPGSDRLEGGPGNDVFQLDAAVQSSNVDRIIGFKSGQDRIYLDDDIFVTLRTGINHGLSPVHFRENLTGRAEDADDRIIYNNSTGELFYDPDGSGALARKKIAVLNGDPSLDFDDFVVTT